jgi:hypothetical protein
VEAEFEFSKGESSQKTANRRPRMRHVHDRIRESLKEGPDLFGPFCLLSSIFFDVNFEGLRLGR